MNNNTKLAFAAVIVSVLAIAALPGATAAGTSAFGTVVAPKDADPVYVLTAGSPAAMCFVDDDASGAFNAGESVYLAAACATVAGNDVRVANAPTGGLGSQVRASNADFGNPLTVLPGAGAFYDADGDGLFTAGDTWYWDTDGSGTVTINDIILSGANAGQEVKSSTSGLNNAVLPLALASTFFDADGSGVYDTGDVIYQDSDGSGTSTVQDVRLSGAASDFGHVVTAKEYDTTYALVAGSPAAMCFVDDDASGAFNAGESVYLAAACATVAGNDVRVANAPTGGLGSQVRASNADFGNPLTVLPGAGAFYDADGDGLFTAGDTWYWDTDASGTVTINDIILSGSNAGQEVKSSTSGLNNAVLPLALASTFFDADGSGVYDTGDVVYQDSNGDGFGSIQDVRLSGASSDFGHVLAPGDYDVHYALLAGSPGAMCFVDDDASGAFNAGESVYLAAACATVAGNDVRIANAPTGGQGSQVRASNADFGNPLTVLPGAGAFYDADGDGLFTTGDTWYWDTDGSGTVTINDIILSGANAGMEVKSTTSGLNNAVLPLALATAFFDADGSTVYDTGDSIYQDTNGDGLATVQDVRMSGAVPTCSSNCNGQTSSQPTTPVTPPTTPVTPPTTPVTPPTTPVTPPTTPVTPPTSPPVTPGGNGEQSTPPTSKAATPGFELVALVAALGAALVLVRKQL